MCFGLQLKHRNLFATPTSATTTDAPLPSQDMFAPRENTEQSELPKIVYYPTVICHQTHHNFSHSPLSLGPQLGFQCHFSLNYCLCAVQKGNFHFSPCSHSFQPGGAPSGCSTDESHRLLRCRVSCTVDGRSCGQHTQAGWSQNGLLPRGKPSEFDKQHLGNQKGFGT